MPYILSPGTACIASSLSVTLAIIFMSLTHPHGDDRWPFLNAPVPFSSPTSIFRSSRNTSHARKWAHCGPPWHRGTRAQLSVRGPGLHYQKCSLGTPLSTTLTFMRNSSTQSFKLTHYWLFFFKSQVLSNSLQRNGIIFPKRSSILYNCFWPHNWKHVGLVFKGMSWTFLLSERLAFGSCGDGPSRPSVRLGASYPERHLLPVISSQLLAAARLMNSPEVRRGGCGAGGGAPPALLSTGKWIFLQLHKRGFVDIPLMGELIHCLEIINTRSANRFSGSLRRERYGS